MKRVTRAGGVIASCHPLEYSYDVSFFWEWFHPVFEMAARKGCVPKSFFFLPETAGISGIEVENSDFPTVFHDPEKIIRHFIYDIGLFQDDLVDLHWKARDELIETLKESGAAVCSKHPRDERIIQEPTQNVKGVS